MPLSPSDLHATVQDALRRHRRGPENLLQVLIEIQQAHGCVPLPTIQTLAEALNLPLAHIRGVIGFYAFLSEQPVGRYRVLFADNITDRMQGSEALFQSFLDQFQLEPDQVSADGLLSIARTSCTGLCDQGPGLLVNGWAIPRASRERLARIGELIRSEHPVTDWPDDLFTIEDNIQRSDILLDNRMPPGDAIRAAIARGETMQEEHAANSRSWRESLIAPPRGSAATLREIELSNLRGRGGAGFPTALKWELSRDAPGEQRFVVCNADEGEPGTFKDRVLLTRQADLLFEGMTICAYVTGASQGFLYLRGEYRYLLRELEQVLERRRREGLLGQGICGQDGFEFDIKIHLGAGAYVCGEETALIESLEGKRGIPRNRPPFPVTHGYLQKPTVVNNVETFCSAALIAKHGGAWYRDIGSPDSTGTKLLSVSGDCERPGIYEYPFGVSVAQVLADCGAKHTQAVQVSGPSGFCTGPDEFDKHIGFADLPTAGSFMIFDQTRDLFEVAHNFVDFFAHESCGFCTPCRVGTSMLKRIMDKIRDGHGAAYDLAEVEKLDRVLQQSAHCGLGHTACNPTLDTLKRFYPAYERRLKSVDFEPAFDLDRALARAREMAGRDDERAHLHTEESA